MNDYYKIVVGADGQCREVLMDAAEAAQRKAEEDTHAAERASPAYAAGVVELASDPRLQRRIDRDQAIKVLGADNPLRLVAEAIEASIAATGVRKGRA